MSTFGRAKRAQAARPAASVAQIRARAIRRLLAIAEDAGEKPEAAIAACRALLDLPIEVEATPVGEATATQDKLQARAAKAIAAAFRELENPVEIDAELPALLPAPDIEGPSPVAAAAVEPVPATVKVEPILSARAARLRDPQWRKKPG